MKCILCHGEDEEVDQKLREGKAELHAVGKVMVYS